MWNDKTKTIRNEFDVLYSRERAHGLGEYSASQGEHFPWGILGKREFYGSLEAVADETAWLAEKLGISLSSWQVQFP